MAKASKAVKAIKTAERIAGACRTVGKIGNTAAAVKACYDTYQTAQRECKTTGGKIAYMAGTLLAGYTMGKAANWGANKLKNLANKALPKLRSAVQEGAGKFTDKVSKVFSRFGNKGSLDSSVYYHVTTAERAQIIMATNKLGVPGNKWESRVFAWTEQPTKRQASIAGIGKEAQTVIRFNTNASFEPDIGNATKSIADIVVQTTDGQRVPISISNVESVGFKKEWWQFWKK